MKWVYIISVLLDFAMLCHSYLWSDIRQEQLRNKSKEMFFHAYNNYMNHAYPADELMPLSCKGRYRELEPPRGAVDGVLGNFSLSLVDSLDTLFIMNEFDEFENAIRRVVVDVSFDQNADVSVFETNIRVLGGLLGGHVSALALKKIDPSRLKWYDNQLIKMAVDLGNRLLPAFNTSTGLPYPHINLRTGKPTASVSTCTACAGTLILEFAALSRFSGNPAYEARARGALSYLWQQRNRHSDLVGTEININSGEWLRRESGVGAGIDSYYESLLKAYGLLGEGEFLERFRAHYAAVERYLGAPSNGATFPFSFLSVFMHRPSERARFYMDALQAFWPGLQALTGDVEAAAAHHEMLYMVHQRHGLLPEAFTADMDIYWPHYLLRPELAESTYLLHRFTRDPYYLRVGAELLESIERHTRVPCGFAAIEDIRTMQHSDRMDSFVLAETFKYFYLLFSDSRDLPVDLDNYIFTTEAHLLPARQLPGVPPPLHPPPPPPPPPPPHTNTRVCPATRLHDLLLAKGQTLLTDEEITRWRQHSRLEEIRRPLRRMAKLMQGGGGGKSPASEPPISAAVFNANNLTHLQMLRQMGIAVKVGKNGELQLRLNRSEADSPILGLSGLKFIEEVIDLNKLVQQESVSNEVVHPFVVALVTPPHFGRTRFDAGPSTFTYFPGEIPVIGATSASSDNKVGSLLVVEGDWRPVVAPLVLVEPMEACEPVYAEGLLVANEQLHADLVDPSPPFHDDVDEKGEPPKRLLHGAIAVVKRGGCMFAQKARHVKQVGAVGAIVVDSTVGTSGTKDRLFYMSGDAAEGSRLQQQQEGGPLELPLVFVYHEEGRALVDAMARRWRDSRRPLVAAIAKTNDSPKILTHSLRYLDQELEEQAVEKDVQCFNFSVRVKTVVSCTSGEAIFVEEQNEGWSLTLGPLHDIEDSVAFVEFLDKKWPSGHFKEGCKDLVLAVSDAVISQTEGTSSVTRLTPRWRQRLSECLRGFPPTPAASCSEPSLESRLRVELTATPTDQC